jgi:hypothetical protein
MRGKRKKKYTSTKKSLIIGVIVAFLVVATAGFLHATNVSNVSIMRLVSTFGQEQKLIVTHEGDLILRGEEKLVIEDIYFIQKGSIELYDNAQLTIRNAVLDMPSEYAGAWRLLARDNSRFIMEESRFAIGGWIDFELHENAQARYVNNKRALYAESPLGPWHSFHDSTRLELINTYLGATVMDEAQLSITNSPGIFLELGVKGGEGLAPVSVTESNLIPESFLANWTFPNGNDENILYHISVTDTNIIDWGAFVIDASLTLKDSEEINICLPIHYPYEDETVRLSDLRSQLYEDRTIQFAGTQLSLQNTSVSGWCFTTWEENTLHISDADIDDINHSGGKSKQFYERVTTNVVITSGDMELELRDSLVKGDVTAKDNSVVTLINTTVEGTITKEDKAKVIIKEQ